MLFEAIVGLLNEGSFMKLLKDRVAVSWDATGNPLLFQPR